MCAALGRGGRPAADQPRATRTRARTGDAGFDILLIHRGPAPAVETIGEGKGQKLAVGRRTIAFDGQRLILGVRP